MPPAPTPAMKDNAAHKFPVLFLWFGSRLVLLVTSPEATEECFTKNDIIFANRPHLLLGKLLGYNYTSLAWAPYGDHWRNLRRIASLELLSSRRLQMLSHIRADEVRSLIHLFFQASTENPDGTVDLQSSFFELNFNVLMRMIAGKRFYGKDVAHTEEAKRFQDIVLEITQVGAASAVGDFLPIMLWFGNKGTKS
ncbi:hypothetical protein RJ639_005913 [Escallonia herrerae]|uniref:Cytochrome P450 n=1 Tax=Escallonia herrerae TaxID=1293975 RepID=A0AA88VZX2_9ASTE|nr:hypothetical protein RJ639_005913 [Escallonia herrerae]